MKRIREIDLEAPVHDDDDGEDDGDDSGTSALDETPVSKKSRWMHKRTSGIEVDAGICQNKLIEGDAKATPAGKPSHPAVDTRVSAGSKFIESRHQQEPDQTGKSEDVKEAARDLLGDNVTKLGNEYGADTIASKEHRVRMKEKHETFSSPLSVLLHANEKCQDGDLHPVFERQNGLLSQVELSTRLGAICSIGTLVEFIKEDETRKLVTQSILQQLWKEEEPAALQALVKVLCRLAVTSCAGFESKDGNDLAWDVSQDVAGSLLLYVSSKDLKNSPLKSGLKVQIFRSLYLIGKAGCYLEADSFGALAKEQLGSLNPRLREWGIQLLVQTFREKNATVSRETKDSDKTTPELLENVRKRWAEGESLMHTLLEYARDPYPSVREVVVCSILKLHSKGYALSRSTYMMAFTLLQDSFESVRTCAIKLVGMCVKQATSDVSEGSRSNYVDNAFMQICNMMTDMIMPVRQEACNTLAQMTGVSENVLLQSLTKKVLPSVAPSVSDKEQAAGFSADISDADFHVIKVDGNKIFDWSAAGAFVVGLEDEFWEVRSAALKALAKLALSSERMASASLELIVDMINDDSSQVRQQSIGALTHLALGGRLSVLEAHLHMYLGVLEDPSMEIRKFGHDLLSVISFPNIATFQETIRAILKSLEKHPEDEESLVITLEKLGKCHPSHTECIASELVQELRGYLNGEAGLDEPRCVAVLVLLFSAAMISQKIISLIPSQIISLSSGVRNKLPASLPWLQFDQMGFDTVQYTWSMNGGTLHREVPQHARTEQERRFGTSIKHTGEDKDVRSWGHKGIWKENTKPEDSDFNHRRKPQIGTVIGGNQGLHQNSPVVTVHKENRLHHCNKVEILMAAGKIVSRALDLRLLLDFKSFKDVLQILSGCRRELTALKERCRSLIGTLSFGGLYIHCLTLMVQLRANFISEDGRKLIRKASPHDLLNKLDSAVNHIVHCFVGLRFESLLQVLELRALVSLWHLALHLVGQTDSEEPIRFALLELRSTATAAEKMWKSHDSTPSVLLKAVQEQFLNKEKAASLSTMWRSSRQIALSYWPSQMSLGVSVKEMSAAMKAPGSDFDNPIGFIPGLPVGIPIEVTVCNVPLTSSLWIQFTRDSSGVQYKSLDLDFVTWSSGNIRCLSTILQIDDMPTVASSVCRVCIVLEGLDQGSPRGEEADRGPQGTVVPLCMEMEVHLFLMRERGSKQLPHGRR